MASHLSAGPSGTFTFVFTDIEGSTRLLQALGDAYAELLETHRGIVRGAASEAGGTEVDTQGDAFFFVFHTPSLAVRAAIAAQRALAAQSWPGGVAVRVRMGIHTGEAAVSGGTFVGMDVHRAARVTAAAHGGQVLLSEASRVLVQDKLPARAELSDLGYHQLKDLRSPEHLYQLLAPGLPSVFSPVRSLRAGRVNLPTQVTTFVGRHRELEEVRRLLAETRLLTLTGPGGTGKTRLAIEAAREVADDFADGLFYVALSSVRDHSLVPPTIADAVGLTLQTERPILDILKEYFEHRRALLVLDNFEHVFSAASVIGELLQAAAHLRVLVTSRARLHLSAEQELPVPPMELPEPGVLPGAEDLSRYDALALFVNRARAADPTFTVDGDSTAVTEICARLDGLPLAIELAAARLNVLTPELLRQRLEHRLPVLIAGPTDASERQRTLRSTIDWSYDLLGPPDQVLFRRISVFSGGCTIGAADAVIGGDSLDVLEALCSLVEKSLLRRTRELADEPRFRMLETIREYAHDRLVESGEADDIERRHARYYLEVAESAEPHLTTADTWSVAARLQPEQGNLRAAIAYAIRAEETETGLRIASAMWRFWQQRGQLEEGRQWMAQLLALPGATSRSACVAKALDAAAAMAYWQGDYEEASVQYEAALSIWRQLGDEPGAAEVLRSLGYLAGIKGQYREAHALHEQSRTVARGLEDNCAVAYALVGDGMIYHLEGDAEKAQSYFEDACLLFEEVGERYGLATALCLLSRILVERGEPTAAEDDWRRAFQILRDLGDGSGLIIALSDLCAIELAKGRAEAAVRLAGAAAGLGETLKVRPPEALTRPPDPRPAAGLVMGSEAVQSAWEAGRDMTLDQAVAYAVELTGLDDSVRGVGAV